MSKIRSNSSPNRMSLRSLYYEALKPSNSREIIIALTSLGGVANFSEIEATSKVKGSTLVYHLNRLTTYNIIKNIVKGTYELTYKTPFFIIQGITTNVHLVSLLGKRLNRKKPEPEVAQSLLRSKDIQVNSVHVVSSPEALSQWTSEKLNYQWILCYEDEIIDIEKILAKIEDPIVELLEKYTVILDCTSATKPASLAFYYLAEKYLIPLIYVYEENKELRWLISPEDISKQIYLKN